MQSEISEFQNISSGKVDYNGKVFNSRRLGLSHRSSHLTGKETTEHTVLTLGPGNDWVSPPGHGFVSASSKLDVTLLLVLLLKLLFIYLLFFSNSFHCSKRVA